MTAADPATGAGRTVIILADPEDEHALHVQRELTDRGHCGLLLDSFDFPGELQIAFRPGEAGGVTLPDGTHVDGGDVHSIYWRNYNGVAPSSLPDEEQAPATPTEPTTPSDGEPAAEEEEEPQGRPGLAWGQSNIAPPSSE